MISIKSAKEIDLMKKAGHINYLTHQYLKSQLHPGVTTKHLDDLAYKFITEHEGVPSFLNYEGYPASVCISVNDEVVHGIPGSRIIENGDIVSLDIGVIYKGYHSDAAWTYEVGNVSEDRKYLMEHTKNALYAGIKEVRNGARLGTVSHAIEKYAVEHKLGVIRELVGHGVGTQLHEDPDVPNYGKENVGLTLKTGMTIAIEPMLTMCSRKICMLDDNWTIVTWDRSDAAHYEHTVLVTDNGYEILTGE